MIRYLLAATLAALLTTTSVAWAGSSETLAPDRARLWADFLASAKPIPATPAEQVVAYARVAERRKVEPAVDRPMQPPASAPVAVHSSPTRLPSAWLDDYYRVLARSPR
jgi:hypothetical protein